MPATTSTPATAPAHITARTGAISTAEIKARIEAMFAPHESERPGGSL
ncbi:hypothetical protein [Rhodococcus sp. T7]|nr:hypothetical protein [Rhodococcus sp. T7]KAF0957397.1 hypothetical protein MLGJGCBP_09229 [Rhodococcus sp. T7]KAF0962132.1 hypothetical protein MLGJGCBP_04753 [Rhodococcus sp. T7]